jgi:hypothetical protein
MSNQPQPSPAAAVQPIDGPIETRVWPFPPASGPIAWTSQRVQQHAQAQRQAIGEALL